MSADKISDEDVQIALDAAFPAGLPPCIDLDQARRRIAKAVAALAAAGRLLPVGSEVRTERRYVVDPREIPTSTGLLEMVQERSAWTGPWVNVEEGS